jgi:phosphoserine phosphatase
LRVLESAAAARGIDVSETLAVGDGANDVAMVTHAGLGVAWHAKPVLANVAAVRIDHADLTALLYLQGYRESEITELPGG